MAAALQVLYLQLSPLTISVILPGSSRVKDALGDTIPPAPPVLRSLFNLVPADVHFSEIFLDDIVRALSRSTWPPPETFRFPYQRTRRFQEEASRQRQNWKDVNKDIRKMGISWDEIEVLSSNKLKPRMDTFWYQFTRNVLLSKLISFIILGISNL